MVNALLHTGYRPFPSPSGVSHFSIFAGVLIGALLSFRPLPGYLISQLNNPNMTLTTNHTFPSPSGVSHFSIGIVNSIKNSLTTFPSPSGVSHFSIRHYVNALTRCLSFRPLPGYLISQLYTFLGSGHTY